MDRNQHTCNALDAVDTITASITQAQSILTAARTDLATSSGGALAPETLRDLLWAADSLLDRALGATEELSPAPAAK